MSETIILSGCASVLDSVFAPPITLDPSRSHYIGLVEFVAYNAIPNVTESNRVFQYGDAKEEILLPRGAYEISAIEQYIKDRMGPKTFR